MSQFQQEVTCSSKNFNMNQNSLFTLGGKNPTAAANPSQVSTNIDNYKGQLNPKLGLQKYNQAHFNQAQNPLGNQNNTPSLDKLLFKNQLNKTQQNCGARTFNGYKNVKLSNSASFKSVVHPQSKQPDSINLVQSKYSQNIQNNLGKQPLLLSRNDVGNFATLNRSDASKLKESGVTSKIVNSDEETPMMLSGYYSNDYFDKVFGEEHQSNNKQVGTGWTSSPFSSQLQKSILNAFQSRQSKLAASFAGFWFCSNQPAMAFAGGVPNFSPNSWWVQQSIVMIHSPFFQEYSWLLTYAIFFPTAYWFIIQPSIQQVAKVAVLTDMVGWPYTDGRKGPKK